MAPLNPSPPPLKEEYDVVVVGAGISGIGAAYHLQAMCPESSFVVLESRAELGGTWSFFKYPGLRSDSDMLTFGYSFFPWTRPEILAKAPLILDYLRAVVDKFGLSRYIQYGSAVQKADWSSENGRWAVTVSSGSDSAAKTGGRGAAAAAPRVIRAKYLFMCGGYYQYDKGNTPNFEGRDVFEKNGGEVIHPQAWEGRDGGKVDVVGKRVAVIGSGATAVTLVPELVKEGAAHVTCVQRSPTYLMSVTPKDYFVAFLRFICVPAVLASRMGRYVQIKVQNLWFHFCTNFPGIARFILQCVVKLFLGFNTDMTHWTPKYDPWKQRLCAVVNGDFFLAIRRGGASMATGHIDRFTAQGIKLKGGQEVKADVIVTATGMNMQRNFPMSFMDVTVDGKPYVASEHLVYKGLMLSNVPNFFYVFGYPNISWTLKADLIARFACRMVEHMRVNQLARCAVVPGPDVEAVDPNANPLLTSGYIQRASAFLPRQGTRQPWVMNSDYFQDVESIDKANFDNAAASEIVFTK